MVVEIINDLTMLLLEVIIQQLFSVIALRFDNVFAEIKGYAMLQFSYMMLKIYGKVPYQPIASVLIRLISRETLLWRRREQGKSLNCRRKRKWRASNW